MKFLLDANLPYSAKEAFGSGDEVFHVRDIKLQHESDQTIAKWAKHNKAVIVSRDLDFANIILMPASLHYGVVVLRVPDFYNSSSIKRVLQEFLANIKRDELIHALIIVEEGRYRIRNRDELSN